MGTPLRIKLILLNEPNGMISANYFYPLSAIVYKLLKFGSPEFSSFLHDIGYKLNSKTFKLFTFTLRLERFQIQRSRIKLLSNYSYLYISSPLVDEFIQNFVIGTFETQKIELSNKTYKTSFQVSQVESLPEIEFYNKMRFRLQSPMILSTKRESNGKLMPYYYRYNDGFDEMNKVFSNNLKNKNQIITGEKAEDKEVLFKWDAEYIKSLELKGKRATKKQTIKENTPEQTEVIGNLIPFSIEGDVGLIKTGYECGFGNMNSLGFGYADLY